MGSGDLQDWQNGGGWRSAASVRPQARPWRVLAAPCTRQAEFETLAWRAQQYTTSRPVSRNILVTPKHYLGRRALDAGPYISRLVCTRPACDVLSVPPLHHSSTALHRTRTALSREHVQQPPPRL
jgi:hypothetical protein